MTYTISTQFRCQVLYEDPDENLSVELPVQPDSEVVWDADRRVLRWATVDENPWEYEFPEGVEFVQANSRHVHYVTNPQAWIEHQQEAGNHLFAVGVYEHSAIEYSLAGESLHSNDQWDYAVGACIAIPPDFTNPEEAARAILREYTAWCNGWVYAVWEMEVDGDQHTDVCGGFYGDVEDILKEGL